MCQILQDHSYLHGPLCNGALLLSVKLDGNVLNHQTNGWKNIVLKVMHPTSIARFADALNTNRALVGMVGLYTDDSAVQSDVIGKAFQYPLSPQMFFAVGFVFTKDALADIPGANVRHAWELLFPDAARVHFQS